MIDLINKLFDKHTWFNLLIICMIILAGVVGFVSFVHVYPLSFTLTQAEIRDELYETRDKTYRIYSEQSDGTLNVHISITDKVKKKNAISKHSDLDKGSNT